MNPRHPSGVYDRRLTTARSTSCVSASTEKSSVPTSPRGCQDALDQDRQGKVGLRDAIRIAVEQCLQGDGAGRVARLDD